MVGAAGAAAGRRWPSLSLSLYFTYFTSKIVSYDAGE